MSDSSPPSDSNGSTRSSWPYETGERIAGKYKLLRPLGEGGMGVVWVAHNLGLDVQVALKFIRVEASSPGANERLIREARVAARLDHPAIVRILDVGHSDRGDPFLAMELLDGETLAAAQDRVSRFDAITAVRLLLPIAGALAAMHRKGMIHRDVKPDTLFLARNDSGNWQPKLVDFGLAKYLEPTHVDHLTRRGIVLGSPGYMAPEVLAGDEADARTDVWALCVVLYEAITGVRPYGLSRTEVRELVMSTQQPEPIMRHGAGDAELWAVLSRGFRPRNRRWASMEELGKALAIWLWNRSQTQDIAGVSLRPAWLSPTDVASVSLGSATIPPPSERSSAPSSIPRSFSPTELDLRPVTPSSSPGAVVRAKTAQRSPVSSAPPIRAQRPSKSEADRSAPAVATRRTNGPLPRAFADRALRVALVAVTVALLIVAGVIAGGQLGRSSAAQPLASNASIASAPSMPVTASAPSMPVTASAPPSARSETSANAPASSTAAAPPKRTSAPASQRQAPPGDLKDPFH
ncbi:MAG: protein kinase [Minicystis sp.]